MNSGHVTAGESLPRHHAAQALGARRSPGFSDEIGERAVIFDEADTPVVELLRFRRTLTAIPGFEVALRRRVERLRHFRHPLFATSPTVEYVDEDRCLALVSPYTPARRLSTVLGHAQDPALAASLVHQLVPALEALGSYDDGIGHGALTASRIVISPDGSPTVIEHVLGPALERLHLSAPDCFQLAVIATSMLLGRPLSRDEYTEPLSKALDTALPAADTEAGEPSRGLRTWLERALRRDHRGFLSMAEAKEALSSVSAPGPDVAQRWRELLDAPLNEIETEPGIELAGEDRAVPQPASSEDLAPASIAVVAETATAPEPSAPTQSPPTVSALIQKRLQDSFRTTNGAIRWGIAALVAFAVAEALVIAVLLAGRTRVPPQSSVAEISLETEEPGSPVVVDGQSAGVTPLRLTIDPGVRSISVASAPRSASIQEAIPRKEAIVGSTGQQPSPLEAAREAGRANARARSVPAAVEPPRIGRIKVSSPIALEIFDGDKRLGSAEAGLVSAAAGRRELDFVNSALGFRSRQVVDVKSGQTISVSVSPPDGRININAVPWAEVLIDGKPVGETPIGNLSIPLGEHEIVFRHPKLGEVRQTAIVRSDAVTRVSANLER